MKHKVSELEGALLDAAVAKAEGLKCFVERSEHLKKDVCYANWAPGAPAGRPYSPYCPSSYWNIGGPIIERERISVVYGAQILPDGSEWEAVRGFVEQSIGNGATPLIAAMRCYVISKLGEEVELPDNA